MRVWIIATALVFVWAASASAQTDRATTAPQDGVRAERQGEYIDVCINSEVFHGPGGVNHFFRASGPATYIHVTGEGLRITDVARPSGGASESSPEVEARLNPQIEALRAAASSNSRVRLRHSQRYLVTEISIAYRQRCG